jgi:plasmid stabilization system protein ParE
MTESFIISPLAETDIAEAYDWYERRSAGLGKYFLRQLNDCFDAIRQRPLMFEIAVDDYRRALVRKFPYAVYFEHSADQIVVDAVFHCSQDPAKWQARLHRPQ